MTDDIHKKSKYLNIALSTTSDDVTALQAIFSDLPLQKKKKKNEIFNNFSFNTTR